MIRLISLVVFASILACALAQTTTEAATTTDENTTTESSTTTEAPPISPTQEPQGPGNYSYAEDNKVCIRLNASLQLDITYANSSTGSNMLSIELDNITTLDEGNSSCGDNQAIGLSFDILGEEANDQFITFRFQKGSNKEWSVSGVFYSFQPSSYPQDLDLPNHEPDVMITLAATRGLMETSSTNLNVGTAYTCAKERDLMFNNTLVDKRINATLTVTGLKIQAFIEDKDGQYGSVNDCNASKGNKIVPIAVGAALAGLVIVVLIAYLIGRLKSRRQSTYEALS